MNPTFTIARLRASVRSDSPARIAGLERVIDGLRKAGVQENHRDSSRAQAATPRPRMTGKRRQLLPSGVRNERALPDGSANG